MARPSGSSGRSSMFAAYWVADALAADDSLHFSLTKDGVGASPDSLTGAPEAVRERVALRALQELVVSGGGGAAAEGTRMLGVDSSRSCEDLLLGLVRQVGSSGSLEKNMILPFSPDIQKFIGIKRCTLPETSFELLKKVYPEIAPVVLPTPMKQNGNGKHDNISHDLVSAGKTGFATDGAQLQQDDLAILVNQSNKQNLRKNGIANPDSHQPWTSDNRCFDQPQEGSVDTVGVSIRSSKDFLGSNTGKMSECDMVDHATIVQPQSCGIKNPNTFQYNNGDRPPVASIQLPKDSIPERSNDSLPVSTSEKNNLPEFIAAEDTETTLEPSISKTHPNFQQHDTCDKANQDVGCGSAGIQTSSALLSEGFNGAIRGDKSEIKDPSENTTEHTKMFEQENSDKDHLGVDCSDKVNQALYDDGNIMRKNMVYDGLNVQTPESHSCSIALHNKNSEANHLSEQNIGRNTAEVQKDCCNILDANDKRAKQASNKKTMGNTVAETLHVHCKDDSFSGLAAAGLLSMTDKIPFCTQDQDSNGNVEGLSENDFCVKCGKDGQLLKCGSCLLAAHDTCFGSPVTFDDSGQFYCPVCAYTKASQAYQKAKKIYSEARKNLSTFFGRKQSVEQQAASRRQGNQQFEVDNLSHRDEEPDRQRKKQKINAKSDSCPQEVATEKVPIVQKSDVAPMNKHPVVQNNRSQEEIVGAHEQSGSDDSLHKTRHSSQNKCSPAANKNVDAGKENDLASPHQSEDSDEIEATSSNDSRKKSSPPWCKLRRNKARCQDKDTSIPSTSRKARGQHDQHMASPSRKRNYVHPPKRYSNPVASAGRRSKLWWTEQEEAILREAIEKFAPSENGQIPWIKIHEYGRDVFHKTRFPSDLRVKWRNMKKSGL
uniref:Myb-like domain-containing protein n=1 Tax=Leersia perrieri TaxID=77586 RepID=A0A0D9XVK5_9ORYZ